MKHILSILTITVMTSLAIAQKIHFTDTSNSWYQHYADIGMSEVDFNFYYKDSIITIDTLEYKYLTAYTHSKWGGSPDESILIREDTVANKVFAKVYSDFHTYLVSDTNEHLLYDFNLQTGDTFTAINKYGTFQHVVQLDSITIGGINHKLFKMQGFGGSTSYRVIEGVGSTMGIMFPLYPYVFESNTELLCFKQSGVAKPFSKKVDYIDNTQSCHVSVRNLTYNNGVAINISPQPATTFARIEMPAYIKSGIVFIINQLGQTVYEQIISGKTSITIDNPGTLNGLNYYRIIDKDNNMSYSGKIIFH
ncbi:MAG: hypothetical protein H6550_09955 [Chitinophagales bacterium]|nr:hypothetical protein [Chitinophagales bacterium]